MEKVHFEDLGSALEGASIEEILQWKQELLAEIDEREKIVWAINKITREQGEDW